MAATKKRKGYKVVKRAGRKFCSCVMDVAEARAFYNIGSTTQRRMGCGPLAVFGQKADAIRFVKSVKWLSDAFKGGFAFLFRCEYSPSEDERRWYTEKVLTGYQHSHALPQGTRIADEVTLLKQVEGVDV